jgi:hypothetical protein
MKRVAVTFLASLCLLAGCSGVEPAATRGTGALGERLTTMDDLVDWMRDTAGECDNVTPQSLDGLRKFVGPDIAARFEPYVEEWVTCKVSSEFPKVGLLLFTGDAQRKFQESWHDGMKAGELGEGPTFAFGNGFAVSAGFLGVARLGLYFFRCDFVDPRVKQVPADVPDCVFANPEWGHGH